MSETRTVIAVNFTQEQAILDDGTLIPVKHWIDSDGDFCDPDEAQACVAGSEQMGWWAVDLSTMGGTVH